MTGNGQPPRHTVPKLCGADIELGNFVLRSDGRAELGDEAARTLLRELRSATGGVSGTYGAATTEPGNSGYDPTDRARCYLPTNGGCAYIDLDPLELCIPEVLSAHEHVAGWHAMIRLTQEALEAVNLTQPRGRKVQALVNNSDGHGNSYGSHLSFLVTRRAWDNIVYRRLHHQAYLAAFQVSSIVYTGQGKVGSENDAPPVRYQLSQRADFFETMSGLQTTHRRPLVNTRDEPLAGVEWSTSSLGVARDHPAAARLHVIFFDNTLCHVASLLKVGATQIVLAMLEEGCIRADLALDDPLAAVRLWSNDPLLETRVPLATGRAVTAVELQRCFLEDAQQFVTAGGCDGIVPRAGEILALWEETLGMLERREWSSLARRVDWVLKLVALERALRRPGIDWASPELKHLDHLYSSLDPAEGLYWTFANRGLVDEVVASSEIDRLMQEPPPDTRAWGRAMLLRRAPPGTIDHVDWDFIRFKLRGADSWPTYWTLNLGSPLDSSRAALGEVVGRAGTLAHVLAALCAERPVSDIPDASRDTAASIAAPPPSHVSAEPSDRRTP
jgi:proteasome accessory factor A